MPLHEYPVMVNWVGGRDGQGDVTPAHSGVQLDLAVPVEYQGRGGALSPEELLTSAIASCYSITFGIVAANRRIPVEKLRVEAVGTVEQQGVGLTFKQVVIRPEITLGEAATDEQATAARDLALKADHYCVVTNAVRDKVQVTVEPTVLRAESR